MFFASASCFQNPNLLVAYGLNMYTPAELLSTPYPTIPPQYALQPVLAAAMLVVCRQYRRSSVLRACGVWSHPQVVGLLGSLGVFDAK